MNIKPFTLLAIVLLSACGDKPQNQTVSQRPVAATQVGYNSAFVGRSFPGKAQAFQEVNLAFNVAGTLIELPINVGDKVKKGAVLAKLDPKSFEAQFKSALAEVKRDNQNFERAKALVGQGHISKADYDLLEAKYAVSEANKDVAEKALKDSVILAPFDGKISIINVKNFQTVAINQPIARLLDTTQIEMIVQIPENLISLVPQAKNITVTFDAFPQHALKATLKEISNEASLDTRTYPVTLIMPQPKDIEILPGMAGKAASAPDAITTETSILTVPASSLMTLIDNTKSEVWVIDLKTQTVHKKTITIGELSPTGVTVLKGLSVGDWVVTAGIHSLTEGQKVTILNSMENK